MTKYAYQIKGALEDNQGDVTGFRVLICTADCFYDVDVPGEVFERELLSFMKFRLAVHERVEIGKLPIRIQNQIRGPIGRWLDFWVLDNIKA